MMNLTEALLLTGLTCASLDLVFAHGVGGAFLTDYRAFRFALYVWVERLVSDGKGPV